MSLLSKIFGQKKGFSGPLSFRDYAERYANVVRTAHSACTVCVEHASSAAQTRVFWKAEDGFEASQFMGSWYSRYLQAPEHLQDLLAGQLAEAHAVQASFDQPEPGLDCILPVIKTLDWRDASARQMGAADVPLHHWPLNLPFVGDLLLAYVEDTPDAMSYITPSRLEALHLDVPALQVLALGNLQRRLPELEVKGGGGRFAARLDRNYDASMVLLFNQWRGRLQVTGDPVVALAARDDMLICGSEDADGVESLQGMARTIARDSPYGLSSQLYVWRDGELQELSIGSGAGS